MFLYVIILDRYILCCTCAFVKHICAGITWYNYDTCVWQDMHNNEYNEITSFYIYTYVSCVCILHGIVICTMPNIDRQVGR